MPACDSRLEALIGLVAGDLDDGARRTAQEHVASCAGCREELAELQQTEKVLRMTSNAPDDLLLSGFAVRAADRAVAFRDRSPRGLWWSFTRAMRFTMAFSATAAAASVLFFTLSRQPVVTVVKPAREAVAVVKPAPHVGMPDSADVDPSTDSPEWAWDDSNTGDVSLDTALDSLSTDEIDELAQEIGNNTEG